MPDNPVSKELKRRTTKAATLTKKAEAAKKLPRQQDLNAIEAKEYINDLDAMDPPTLHRAFCRIRVLNQAVEGRVLEYHKQQAKKQLAAGNELYEFSFGVERYGTDEVGGYYIDYSSSVRLVPRVDLLAEKVYQAIVDAKEDTGIAYVQQLLEALDIRTYDGLCKHKDGGLLSECRAKLEAEHNEAHKASVYVEHKGEPSWGIRQSPPGKDRVVVPYGKPKGNLADAAKKALASKAKHEPTDNE